MIYQGKDNVFHLQTRDTSYLLRALPSGQLESMYYGKKIRNCDDFTFLYDKHEAGYSNASPRSQKDTSLSLDHIALEYSAYGKGDYRLPAMDLLAADDNFTTDFLFDRAFVLDQKPELHGLPSSYGPSQTLTVVMVDKILGAELQMFYTVFEDCNVITRSVRLLNKSKEPIHIKELMSMQLDLQRGDYTMLTFDANAINMSIRSRRASPPSAPFPAPAPTATTRFSPSNETIAPSKPANATASTSSIPATTLPAPRYRPTVLCGFRTASTRLSSTGCWSPTRALTRPKA